MTKKKTAALLALILALTAVVWASAAGDAGNPLISLSYLKGTFTQRVEQETERKLDESDRRLSAGGGASASPADPDWKEHRTKADDVLVGHTGTGVMLLAGELRLSCLGGAVIDVTTGKELSDGAVLVPMHRYLVAEDTSPLFVTASKTAVVHIQGEYELRPSDAVDYNAMAAALKELHLFRGSMTAYGQGFDLEKAPTRLQALIMFIRVLGEENEALAWSGETPFRDIQKGSDAEKYVGYAYSKGYTNGYSATAFKPAGTVNAYQYTEFLLRAMGHSSAANTNLADTLERAQLAGVLTAGEAAMLRSSPFLRAELVYLSYYALDGQMARTGETLAAYLERRGVFTNDQLYAARALVSGQRLA